MVVAAPFEQVTRAAATALPMQIAMLFYMVLLDLVGPHIVFSLTNGCRALVWRTRDAVMTSTLPIAPTADCSECPEDLMCCSCRAASRVACAHERDAVPTGGGWRGAPRDVLAGRAHACLRKRGRRTRGKAAPPTKGILWARRSAHLQSQIATASEKRREL
jgi:hypothetical protein